VAFRGRILAEPIPRPGFTLLDTRGEPYDFFEATRGKVTLLFFGYTHCPDVCPVHMGNIAAVLHDLGAEGRRRIEVVFVTTDPGRDTPQRIRSWLDRFDPRFVGLRGNQAEIDSIQRSLRLPPSVLEPPAADGSYGVGHAAQVLAFSSDGPARIVYPFGTRQADWAHDLPLLVAGEEPVKTAPSSF
jgi:protein SCO1/2